MKELVFSVYGYAIFFYSLGLIFFYVLNMLLSRRSILKYKRSSSDEYIKYIIEQNPYIPGVSIVAPAYNEEKTIVDNVNSLLMQDYPKFEVIIVNDGSKDLTLEKMITNFSLVEVPYVYVERIKTKPFLRLLMSEDPKYSNLIVVDKENGGTKADAVNAGLNVTSYPYFINTDVDCLLSKNAIQQCIVHVLNDDSVIAVSGVMACSNGFKVEQGEIKETKPSKNLFALFQTIEYMRSFLVGKLGWSTINAMPNVSGGYGMFDTEICIKAGGYSYDSFAEDMDALWRMISYSCDFNKKYRVIQIPVTCCWTEMPSTLTLLYRQRTRWGRGLLQTFKKHYKLFFKSRYRQLGLITMPYMLIFELFAPIVEFVGMLVLIYLAFTGAVNWQVALLLFGAIFTFNLLVTVVIFLYDWQIGSSYPKRRHYLILLIVSMFEFMIYHPLIVCFSIKGYLDFILMRKPKWGVMTRTGFGAESA
ncbi:MAG: glycosyltransferase family 2 protein [Phocaeicola sp.]